MLREDKDALTAQLGELRVRYRELFDNELSLRTELLSCEQDKLALSKAFVAFQLERDTQLSMLQKAVKSAEAARDAEAKKNQQLSLELIVAVNQKQKFQGEMETIVTQLRARQAQLDDKQTESTKLQSDNEELRREAVEFNTKLDAMRKDLVRRELELERAEWAAKKEQLETQQAGRDADSDDLKREIRDKEVANTALKTKSDENEELVLALERTRHDSQAQLETFRLKLALLHQSGGDAGESTGIRALRELLASYQEREREVRDELDSARNAGLRLTRRLREYASEPHQNDEGVHATDEIQQLHARLEAAKQQLAAEMQQRSEQALILAQLEAQNANLRREQKETNVADPNELETLRAAKSQLESRLSSTKAHWMKLLEQVERRCAELLTRNVMLTEDNENIRKHLTKVMQRT
ncbi:hypothetical protein PInf_015189 [Phytophthora infestans]|nr:hypothetical protein PInf_015189 [Phytophthora infestans]